MLKPAILYNDLLQGRFMESVFQDRFKFYSRESIVEYLIPIYQDSREMLQMVGVDDNGVVGYFGAKLDRETDTARELVIINFRDKNHTFATDLHDFFLSLFDRFGMQRVTWWVVVGNPGEAMYDNIIKRHGGRIVGTFTNDAKLSDGRLYSVKWYEVTKENFNYAREYRRNGGVFNG
ncbi:MAG: hypothetical protein JL50_10840 [Peptococcaceae bacterium BICA1-7]|nr:MAG: hypothetical protein JL50_10840 [Peptococcaceae bacterium BICA1-7]HBV95780.1 hypothetical protein [Desulfotomaculum sp.]